jgi:D-beta-D-heptose 7-phosphate kinase/D-beta-D-heptose 1-phosphate adenosyltransferase
MSSRAEALAALAARLGGQRVWVVGDLMLDEYLRGAAERISPEAPVPVVTISSRQRRPGGAANVALQLAALGAVVELAGAVGDDEPGRELRTQCAAAGIGVAAVAALPGRCTTQKLRVLSHAQQVVRLDWEETQPPAEFATGLLARLAALPAPACVIVSDYAKGVVSPELLGPLIERARSGGATVLVDPKHRDFRRYQGAHVVTPNLRELESAAGCSLEPRNAAAIAAAARRVLGGAGLETLIVTLGEEGMLIVPRDGPEIPIPAMRHPVYDVTGAGDTAIAVLALGLAAGASLADAAAVANAAAGCAVGAVGAVAVERAEIVAALHPGQRGIVLDRAALAARLATWRRAGKRIVFTNGCFDLLHAGHLSLLHGAAALGDVLVLAINSDASVRRLKGPERPLVPAAERVAMLAALECVDAVTVFDEDTPEEILRAVRPDVLVKGQDYQLSGVVGRDIVESYGGRVVLLPLVQGRSTSSLVERIRAGAKPAAG